MLLFCDPARSQDRKEHSDLHHRKSVKPLAKSPEFIEFADAGAALLKMSPPSSYGDSPEDSLPSIACGRLRRLSPFSGRSHRLTVQSPAIASSRRHQQRSPAQPAAGSRAVAGQRSPNRQSTVFLWGSVSCGEGSPSQLASKKKRRKPEIRRQAGVPRPPTAALFVQCRCLCLLSSRLGLGSLN